VGFRLKGGGWYETDFKHDKRHNVVESEGGEKQKTESGNSESASGASVKPGSRTDASEKKPPPSESKSDGKAKV
jgi:predicted nucleic acid-binding Zn ribbon protein